MADKTKIEWTDATWNVVNGCTRISEGCGSDRGGGCYAERLAATRLRNHPSRSGLATMTSKGPRWTGEVRFNEAVLTQPLRWKRPRRIFVCAHGDLFHESVPDEWIDRVFAVMALCPQHQFQVLTKRSARMREYLTARAADPQSIISAAHRIDSIAGGHMNADYHIAKIPVLPLPNVWLGVSVEDQQRADERVPDLLATPAAVRWLSCEPLLGPVDLTRICLVPQAKGSVRAGIHINVLEGSYVESGLPYIGEWDVSGPFPANAPALALDWIVVGGESGPKARPMHPDWARSLRDQCEAAGVPFLFKQWGEWRETDGPKTLACHRAIGEGSHWLTRDGKLHDAREPFSIYHEYKVAKFGKKRAGRLLDGVEHNGFPVVLHG